MYRPIHISQLEEEESMKEDNVKQDIRWMKEYKSPYSTTPVGRTGVYFELPYTNIHILVDKAVREGRGVEYVTYGVEVHLKQQMNWLRRLYGGSKDVYDTPGDRDRFDSIMKSIEVYTDFLSFVVERLGKE